MIRQIDAATADLELDALEPQNILNGTPATSVRPFTSINEVEVGIWEITPGTVRDIETDEAFVVLSGDATVTFADGEVVELTAGSLVRLNAGESTVWEIRSTLRKVYVA